MGKDYIPMKLNGFDIYTIYQRILFAVGRKKASMTEASWFNFNIMPKVTEINEIEAGSGATKETIIRLKDNGYCVVAPISFEELKL